MKTEWQKAEYAYNKAASNLIKLRDELYPVGTVGISKHSGFEVTVLSGSYYPDQIRTCLGHMSPSAFLFKETPNE